MAISRRLQRHVGAKTEAQSSEDVFPPVVGMQAPLPRHCMLPDVKPANEGRFQLFYLSCALALMALQFTNLYNAVNWLPNSVHDNLDLAAIDTDLLVLLVLILSYRMLKFIIVRISWLFRPRMGNTVAMLVQGSLLFIYFIVTVIRFISIIYKYPLNKWLSLLLLPVLYFLVFGPNIPQMLAKHLPSLSIFSKPSHPYELLVPPSTEKTSKNIFHACSFEPEAVRREVFLLKTDFNYRLKMVFYEVTISTYYGTIVPIIFCKCAHSIWSELTIWPKGVNVKHVKGLFKAEGINNTAEPGNSMHIKFYMMFSQPEYIYLLISAVCVLCTLLEFAMLSKYRHWQQ
ncbi:TMEM39A [Bugula neritina]|uniref:TMEM39A n=1 Tax=Bugula neritina TaxID=10212 RepID=A0A7J7KFE1_BUGNE|nr:TMEM39A [Bugula neritina]